MGMKSILQLLEAVEDRFSSEYKEVSINGQRCFISDNGTVFFFIVLNQLRGLVVEYANSFEEAQANMFEDGDLISIDQDYDKLISEIQEELIEEVA